MKTIMKDICYKKLWFFILTLVIIYNIKAQEQVFRTIEKSYDFTNSGELYVENKYGTVILNGWNQNTIGITIKIKVKNKEKEEAQELLSRIQPTITISGGLVHIISKIEEKNNSFFSRMLSKTNPFDFNKGSIQIDYVIYLPKKCESQIINKFGDVMISDWYGKLKAELQHGDMWINNDLKNASIQMKFGKLHTKSIDNGTFELKNSEFEIENSKDLKITTSGSSISINNVANLEINSSKDKINIKHLERIQGELRFSNIKLKEIESDVTLKLDVADLRIDKILKSVPNINIEQKSSDLNINISNLNFEFYAFLEQGLLRIPKSFKNIKTDMIDRRKKQRNISATYGKLKKGEIKITGEKGVILLQER